MEMIGEEGGGHRILHAAWWPGLLAYGPARRPLALPLMRECRRLQQCFAWLEVPQANTFCVTEQLSTDGFAAPGIGMRALPTDAQLPKERLQAAQRLLVETAQAVQVCYASFPDAAYDYVQDAPHPDWLPVSGDDVVAKIEACVQRCLAVYDLAPRSSAPLWQAQSLRLLLKTLEEDARFADNTPFVAPDGEEWCAGRWLRTLLEGYTVLGRRLYRLGIAAFGRRYIADPLLYATSDKLLV